MIYGYARVSTQNQERYGNSLEAQISSLKDAGAEKVYYDSFTGTQKHRPQFDVLLSVIKSGDTLVVTKLDRIARSTLNGIEVIEGLLEKGVFVNVLNIGIMDNSPTGRLIRNVFLSFAQFERDMILERTLEGRAIARQREGYREGRPRKEISVNQVKDLLKKQQNGQITVLECCNILNISKSKWYELLHELQLINL